MRGEVKLGEMKIYFKKIVCLHLNAFVFYDGPAGSMLHAL